MIIDDEVIDIPDIRTNFDADLFQAGGRPLAGGVSGCLLDTLLLTLDTLIYIV